MLEIYASSRLPRRAPRGCRQQAGDAAQPGPTNISQQVSVPSATGPPPPPHRPGLWGAGFSTDAPSRTSARDGGAQQGPCGQAALTALMRRPTHSHSTSRASEFQNPGAGVGGGCMKGGAAIFQRQLLRPRSLEGKGRSPPGNPGPERCTRQARGALMPEGPETRPAQARCGDRALRLQPVVSPPYGITAQAASGVTPLVGPAWESSCAAPGPTPRPGAPWARDAPPPLRMAHGAFLKRRLAADTYQSRDVTQNTDFQVLSENRLLRGTGPRSCLVRPPSGRASCVPSAVRPCSSGRTTALTRPMPPAVESQGRHPWQESTGCSPTPPTPPRAPKDPEATGQGRRRRGQAGRRSGGVSTGR